MKTFVNKKSDKTSYRKLCTKSHAISFSESQSVGGLFDQDGDCDVAKKLYTNSKDNFSISDSAPELGGPVTGEKLQNNMSPFSDSEQKYEKLR